MMTHDSASLTQELHALTKLQDMKVDTLYGTPITELVKWAQRRRDGVSQLQEAQKAFRDVIDASTNKPMMLSTEQNPRCDISAETSEAVPLPWKHIQNAEIALNKATAALKQAREGYETVDQLKDVALPIIDAQLAEAATLRRSIALWWRQQIFEQLHQTRLLLAGPTTEQSDGKAKSAVGTAREIWERWSEDNKARNQDLSSEIEEAITKVEELLQGKEAALLKVQLNEVSYWLDLAEAYRVDKLQAQPSDKETTDNQSNESPTNGDANPATQPPGQSQGEKEPDEELTPVYAALACLSRAKILLDRFPQPGQQSNEIQNNIGNLLQRYKSLSERVREALQKGMGKREQSIKRLIDEVDEGLQNVSLEEYLGKQNNCKRVDKLRFQIYLFPGVELLPKMLQVILHRADRVREADRLYQQVQQEAEMQGVYWAYTSIQEAQRLNPVDTKIEHATNDWQKKWKKKNEEFKYLAAAITKAWEKDIKGAHFSLLAQWKSLHEMYNKEGRPEDWKVDFEKAQQTMSSIDERHQIAETLKGLVEQWQRAAKDRVTSNNTEDLLQRTEELIGSIEKSQVGYPQDGQKVLTDAIEGALSVSNGNKIFSDPLLIERTLALKGKMEQSSQQMRMEARHETL